jgi:hypothetical protein
MSPGCVEEHTGGESMSYGGSYNYMSVYARIVRAVCVRAGDFTP